MNFQQSAASGTEAPCGVDGGPGDAGSEEVDQGECETDDDSALCRGGLGGGNTECCEDEDERQQDLDDERTEHADLGGRCVVSTESVASESDGLDSVKAVDELELEEDDEQECRSDESSDELEYEVHDEVLFLHPAVHEHCERYCGVDVASGDPSDAVCHGNH